MTALASPSDLTATRMNVPAFRIFQQTHSREKWQLVDGQLYAMAGGTMRHARIVSNLAFALRKRLQGGPCEVFIADANVVREENDFSSYPDVVVRCGGAKLDREREMTDPTACFEVLSPSTQHLDRGAKLFAYHQIESLQHIALIFPDEIRLEAWTRVEGGFEDRVLKERLQVLSVPALNVEIPLAEIYEGVDANM